MSDRAPVLCVVCGEASPRRLVLPEGEVLLGRDPRCDLRVADARASGRHASLRRRGEDLELRDLGSSNGTRVNDREVERVRLSVGDRIAIGETVLAVEAGEELSVEPGAARPGREAEGHAPDPPGAGDEVGSPGPAQADPAQGAGEPPASRRDRSLLDALAALLSGDASEEGGAALFETMLDGLIEAFAADRAVILVPGPEDELVPACARRRPGEEGSCEEPISRKLVAAVVAEGRARLLSSVETEELRREIQSIAGGLRSILAAPFELPEGRGVLYLDSAMERRRYQEGDREILVAFARAAGDALAKDRARIRAARRSERMAEVQRRRLAAREIVGDSGPMRAVLQEISKAAVTDVSVLVTGESGTGKELVARALHRASPRAQGSFVAVNGAALPPELVESELFGHEKGAFTGADARRLGQFELADGGTLFFDEVGELPLPAQGKLLRALQEKVIQRVGGSQPVKVDFRLISATNVDLQEAVKQGSFREDLFYRIAVFRIPLPPLRRRGEDVLTIGDFFLKKFAREFRKPVAGIEPAARKFLLEHRWPGNIRELRNVIEQAVVREEGGELSVRAILPALGVDPYTTLPSLEAAGCAGAPMEDYPTSFDEARKAFEKQYLIHQIGTHKGNMKATSEAIGLSRKALYLKCDEYGIDYSRFR